MGLGDLGILRFVRQGFGFSSFATSQRLAFTVGFAGGSWRNGLWRRIWYGLMCLGVFLGREVSDFEVRGKERHGKCGGKSFGRWDF